MADFQTSQIKDFSVLEKTVDWAFSSPYKGSILPLHKALTFLDKHWLTLAPALHQKLQEGAAAQQ